jgi:formylglycine-generating enzyme required for sulfatase activity
LQSGDWEPYSPVVRAENGPTFASTFPSEAQQQPEEVFIAVVGFGSKSNASASAAWLMLDPSYVKRGSSAYRLFDLYHGVELPLPQDRNLSFSMDASMESGRVGASGFGALLLTQKALDPALQAFLQKIRALTSKGPIGSFSCGGGPQCAGAGKSWPFYAECNTSVCAGLLQTMVPIAPTPQHAQAPTRGMVSVPGGEFQFDSTGVEWKGNTGHSKRGVGFQFPWEPSASRFHSHEVNVSSLWVQRYPVTNQDYATYLASSGYAPADAEHWLKHWGSSDTSTVGTRPNLPAALANQPVTFVSMEDAREYCDHLQLRLPHAWEWQWLAGGSAGDGRTYPWGVAVPTAVHCPVAAGGTGLNLTAARPANVSAHPAGCSPLGVCDLIGNTWEMTDAFEDQHNRAVLLKGGSHYYAKGSMWYFPNALPINTHQKAFLFSAGYERAATVGFRCVADSSAPRNDTNPCAKSCSRCESTQTTACVCIANGGGGGCPPAYGPSNGKAYTKALNLSALDASDWVAASVKGSAEVSRKASATGTAAGLIAFGLLSTASKAQPRSYCCSPLGLSWSDGAAPHQRKPAPTGDGVDIQAKGGGYTVRVGNSPQAWRLTLFAGCWRATCKLTATTGTGSDAVTQSVQVTAGAEVIMYAWEVTFSGGAVELRWEMVDGEGNLTFHAAVLGELLPLATADVTVSRSVKTDDDVAGTALDAVGDSCHAGWHSHANGFWKNPMPAKVGDRVNTTMELCAAKCVSVMDCAGFEIFQHGTAGEPACYIFQKPLRGFTKDDDCTACTRSPVAPPTPTPPSPPGAKNVLFVPIDDQRPCYKSYGQPCVSPAHDRLAREGMIFIRAFAQFAWCAPSRNSFKF